MLLYVYFILCFFIFYLAGHQVYAILSAKIEKLYQRVFAKLFIGILLITVCYSFLATKGITVTIAIIPLVIFFLRARQKEILFSKYCSHFGEDKKALIPIVILLTVLFSYYYWAVLCTASGYPALTDVDEIFNAHAAMYLNYTGIETLNWNYLNTSNIGPSPYSYFICWIIAFASSIFQQNACIASVSIVLPILYTVLIIGLWAFLEEYGQYFLLQLFCVFIPFMCGLHLPFMDTHPLFNWSFYYFNIFTPDSKLVLFYTVIISCLLLLQKQRNSQALTVFLLLPVFSIVLAPAVFIISALLILLKGKNYAKQIIQPVLTAALILGFYKLFGKQQLLGIPLFSARLGVTVLFAVKTFVYKCESGLITYLPYALAITIGTIFTNKPTRKVIAKAAVFIMLAFTVSFIVWMVLYNYFGAPEMHYYLTEPVINVLLFTGLLYLFIKSNAQAAKYSMALLILPSLSFTAFTNFSFTNDLKQKAESKYSAAYLTVVNNTVKNNNLLLIASLQKDGYFRLTGNPFSPEGYPHISCMSPYNSVIFLNYNCISQNYADSTFKKEMGELNPFTLFEKEQPEKSLEKSQLNFIKKYNIHYLLSDTDMALDSSFRPYAAKIITDTKSKESFIVLKY